MAIWLLPFVFVSRAEQKPSGRILSRPDRGQRSLQMGSPYHRASRHTVVRPPLDYHQLLLLWMCWNLYKMNNFLFISTVKVVCLKLIWLFPKTTLSGHRKWNLSQIFGTLMVRTGEAHDVFVCLISLKDVIIS